MPLGVAFGRTILRIDYNPAMVLAEDLAVRHPAVFPAAERYEALREATQRVNPEEVFPVLEQARELRSAGQMEAGLALLRTFVEAHPGNAEGHLELGDFLFEAGRSQDAIPAFRKACELAPTLSRPYRRLGEALVAAGQVDEALVALKRAEELGDRGRETYQALARVHAERREVALETEARRKAILAVLAKASFKETAKLSPPQLQELRNEFVSVLSRRPPFASFQAEHFWDSVMGSLALPLAAKLNMLQSVLAGTVKPAEISSLFQSLQEEAVAAEKRLGPGARDLQRRLAAEPVDPTDTDALLTLRRGDRADAALLAHLAGLEDPPTARAVAFLEEALQDPDFAPLWKARPDLRAQIEASLAAGSS
jgi:tetratricopeptide (TPR) repeat protein